MPASYQIGDRIKITVTFRNSAGVLADPTSVAIMVKTPAGTESSEPPNKDSVGIYSHQLTLTQSGKYHYRAKGTGSVVAANEGFFSVTTSAFTNP